MPITIVEMAVMGFLKIFKDAGLSTATIQREDITQAQVSNLFWVNVVLGAATTILLVSLSPVVAWFFKDSRLVGVTAALSTTFILTGISVQHMALLTRQMRFVSIAVIQIIALVVGVGVAILMAARGFGYWSLVAMQVGNAGSTLVLALFVSGWRPGLPSRKTGSRSLISFGVNVSGSILMWQIARGMDAVLLGRYGGSGALGLYNRASILLNRPIDQMMSPIGAVFVPSLSRLQSEPDRYRRAFLQVYEGLAIGSFLFTGLVLALAGPIVMTVLGPAWEGAVPIFKAFTLTAIFSPLGGASTWLFASQARGRDWFTASAIQSILVVLAFLIGIQYGAVGMALAYSTTGLFVLLPIAFYFAGRAGPVTAMDLWKTFFCYLPIWGVTYSLTFLFSTYVAGDHPVTQLCVAGGLGMLGGLLFVGGYPPSRRCALRLLQLVRSKRKNDDG